MFTKAEFFAPPGRTGPAAAALALAVALMSSACSLGQSVLPAPPAADLPAVPASAAASAESAGALPPAAAAAPPSSAAEALVRALAYSDRVRSMSPAELNQEVARLGNAYVPASQLQLALALAQLRQTPELVRAQEVLTRLLANPDAEAQPLHPLARLLAGRYGEQRRLEDLLDKQNQQTREVQRRLDQTNERLEALKAIERSLTSRAAAPAAASAVPAVPAVPASRSRPAASAP